MPAGVGEEFRDDEFGVRGGVREAGEAASDAAAQVWAERGVAGQFQNSDGAEPTGSGFESLSLVLAVSVIRPLLFAAAQRVGVRCTRLPGDLGYLSRRRSTPPHPPGPVVPRARPRPQQRHPEPAMVTHHRQTWRQRLALAFAAQDSDLPVPVPGVATPRTDGVRAGRCVVRDQRGQPGHRPAGRTLRRPRQGWPTRRLTT